MAHSDHWYRDDLLEEVGLGSDFVPDTWDKRREYSKAHHENTDETEFGAYILAGPRQVTMNAFTSVFYSNGGQWVKDENGSFELGFHTDFRQNLVEALEYYQDLHSNYSPKNSGVTWNDSFNAIPNKLTPQTYTLGARVKNNAAGHEEFNAASSVTNIGHTPEGSSTKGTASVGPMVLFKDAENPEAAQRFVEFLMSNPEYAARFCWADGPIHCQPAYPGIKESDTFQNLIADDLGDHWSSEQVQRHLTETPKHGVSPAKETGKINPHIQPLLGAGMGAKLVNSVLIGGTPIEQAIDNHAEAMQTVLERSKSQ
jgi:ABC-type glycerol-3-phosphate transport system substrate-binding protein